MSRVCFFAPCAAADDVPTVRWAQCLRCFIAVKLPAGNAVLVGRA